MIRPQIELLVVDDDADFRGMLLSRFERSGFAVQAAADAQQALQLAQRRHFDVAVFDMLMPGKSGIELLKDFHSQYPDCEVILLTGQGTIESAVEAMKLGAFNYLTKPFPLRDLELQVEKAAERGKLRSENERLKTLLARSQPAADMVGNSPALKEVFRLIERANKIRVIESGAIVECGTHEELSYRSDHHNRVSRDLQIQREKSE